MAWLKKIITSVVLVSLSCLSFAEPPVQSGNVYRGEDVVASIWIDWDAGLMLVFDDVVASCSGDPEFEFATVPFMYVLVKGDAPPNEGRIIDRFRGDVMASVWPIFPFNCNIFLTQLPIAQGIVTISGNDNDLFADLNPGNNVNVVKYRAHGFLYTPEGERVRLLWKWNAMWDGDDFSTFTSTTRIKLN